MSKKICIFGARTHNLKNLNLEIPREKLVVVTGLSGSGKSSLAFDTIYAEGQRRYVESLSAYARQFLGLMEKPDVDNITGLSPAICVDQKSASRNPRSTVGTITEIYDYLRLLFAKIGQPHCPQCQKLITRQSASQIVTKILQRPLGSRLMILTPIIADQKGEHLSVFGRIKKAGFIRLRVDGVLHTINDTINLDPQKRHTIEIVVDRIVLEDPKSQRARLADSVELALKEGSGILKIIDVANPKQEQIFSELFACADCGISLAEISPRMFSFNSPHGACPACHGLGTKLTVNAEILFNPKLSIFEGAILAWPNIAESDFYGQLLEAVAKRYNFKLETPWRELTPKQQKIVLEGTGSEEFQINFQTERFLGKYAVKFEGVIPNLERRYRETDSEFMRAKLAKFMLEKTCPVCAGKRLRQEVLSVHLAGKNIIEVTKLSVKAARKFLQNLKLTVFEKKIAHLILQEIDSRLTFLADVGLNYLTLARTANTLSGGEAQRIRLATQIGSKLQGVLYVLDEPSIGLHQADNQRLLKTLLNLRDLGNTILVVEHDEEIMRAADFLVEIGPGAGKHGGQVVAAETPKQLIKSGETVTGGYLAGRLSIPIPKKRRCQTEKFIQILGAQEHNLKNLDVKIPLNSFVGVAGVSGSGKSSLINDILAKRLLNELNGAKQTPGKHADLLGTENLDKVIVIDQKPIGRTPRSNAATYTGIFNEIRKIFALTSDAKLRGYNSGRFSFNVRGGRCESCSGDGLKKIEMHFLPDIFVNCEECGGTRYNRETLEIIYRGKNVAEVLAMTAEEACQFFNLQPAIKGKLQTLVDVGLAYLHLGQSATTLSGGEAQRVKLANELAKRSTGRTLYILDEPTTGLHFADIAKLLKVLQRLVEVGNTVVVIEHNLDILKSVDYLLDLGPEGGEAGGQIVASGTPEEVSQVSASLTGKFLRKMLK